MERLRYFDFDLLIEKNQGRYRARVLQSPAGQASAEFALPFSDVEIENLMLRVGRTRRGVRRLDSPEMQAAKQFGGKLFDAVFAGDVRGALRSSADAANRDGAGLRLRLRLADAPELIDLPWEFLYNASLNRFLALSNKTPLVRYIELPETPRPLKITPPLRVLVMISSPSDYEALDAEREWSKLNDALSQLIANNMVTLERLDKATLGALREKLAQQQFHILHFVGHAGFDTQAQDGMLILEDEQGRGRRASGQYLATVLTDRDSLRLAVLNACEGARTARSDPFAGVAQSLVQQGIPAVVAMQFEITDDASITFSHEFYAALAAGLPVDTALSDARGAIFAHVNDLEWGTPVLYLRAPDGILFTPLASEERAEREPQTQSRLTTQQASKPQSQIDALLAEAQASFTRGDLGAAQKALTALFALEASNAAALELQAKITSARKPSTHIRLPLLETAAPVGNPEHASLRPVPTGIPERTPLTTAPSPRSAETRGFSALSALLIIAIILALLLGIGAIAFGIFNPPPVTLSFSTPENFDAAASSQTVAATHTDPSPVPPVAAIVPTLTLTQTLALPTPTLRPTEALPTYTNTFLKPTDAAPLVTQSTLTLPPTSVVKSALPPTVTATKISATPTTAAKTSVTTPPALASAQFDFESPTTWTLGDQKYGSLAQSAETSHSGKFSGKLSYNFPAIANEFVVLRLKRPFPSHVNGMTAWVYGNGSGHYLNAWVTDSAGTEWAFTFGRITFTGWKQLVAKFDLAPGWPNSAIAPTNRTKITMPMVSFNALVLDAVPHNQASQGVIFLDDIFPLTDTGVDTTPNTAINASCEITLPLDNASVSGMVPVIGTAASSATFDHWEIAHRPATASSWLAPFRLPNSREQIHNDKLMDWQTKTVANGDYLLRLDVYTRGGATVCTKTIRLRISN